jgi:NAD(P)-dependent dehydrogenase (short-subunit alcohol dehydrogenase family)
VIAKIVAKKEEGNGIRSNAVAPGVIETKMGLEMLKAMGEQKAKELMLGIPLHRVGLPKEIGQAIVL